MKPRISKPPSAPLQYIDIIDERYGKLGYAPYRWALHTEPPPWVPLSKPLSECRLGLIASGGIYAAGQVAFHWKDDPSYRMIPMDIDSADLRTSHFAYDQTDARADINVVFPIDTLRRLTQEGVVGALTAHAFTFMGGIYSARRVREDMGPRITDALLEEGADAVLLVPV